MLQSARCLVSLGQFAPAVSSRWPQQHHLDCIQPCTSSMQPASKHAALPAAWSSTISSRGFLSNIMQPDSKVYKERRLIG
jgi:hypothetical protein